MGSFDTYRAQASSGFVSGPLDGYVSLSHFSTDGFREHSQQNNQRVFANFGYRLSPRWETRFYLTYAQTDSELPGNLTKAELEANPRQAQRVPAFLRGFQPVARFDYVTSNWKRDFELFRIANKTGDQRCHQEHNNHRVAELREQHAERTAAACMLQYVGAVLHGAGANHVGGEALVRGTPKDRERLFRRRGMPGRCLSGSMV
jgi:hypothetical protein